MTINLSRRGFLVGSGGIAASFMSGSTLAAFPDKPVTLMVGYAPGGGTDTWARALASVIEPHLGSPMVVVNRPGASSMLAASAIKTAKPDGFTLLMASAGSMLAIHATEPQNRLADVLRDFTLIGGLGETSPALMIATNGPYKTLAELVAALRANPGKLRWSHPGRGTLFHLSGLAFLKKNNVTARDVPFQSGAEARNGVWSDQVAFSWGGLQLTQGFEGQVMAVAVSGEARDPANPSVPTFAELGFPPADLTNPQIVMAPLGLPAAVSDKLRTATKAAVESEEFRRVTLQAGLGGRYESPEKLLQRLESMHATVNKIASEIRT